MEIKVIKTQYEYKEALNLIEKLIDKDPDPGTTVARKLELLSLLIADYEEKNFPNETPDPIEAIKFRMEQENLTQRDLVPYIGSRSKVSEILSRKRPLTLPMIRALYAGLGIPLESLMNPQFEEGVIDWNKFPIKEILKRQWVQVKSDIERSTKDVRQLIESFVKPLGPDLAVSKLYHMTTNIRSARTMDKYALMMWNARIMLCAQAERKDSIYRPELINIDFMRQLVKLSIKRNSPKIACDFLKKYGVILIIEKHLPKTYLDGAAMMTLKGPIIGLTLRHDRLDNFWFCLMHELAHIVLHLKDKQGIIYDDLDLDPAENDLPEVEADNLANEVLIPKEDWNKSAARKLRSPAAARSLARKLGINEAIVAGRMRHYFKEFRILGNLIGAKEVRKCFPEVKWG